MWQMDEDVANVGNGMMKCLYDQFPSFSTFPTLMANPQTQNCLQMKEIIPNNPPAVIGVGGLQPLLCAAPPLRSSLLPLPQSSPPGGQAGPGSRAGPAGRPGSWWTAPDQKCGSKLPFVDFWMPFWTKYLVQVSKK